ncbi:MAG: exodeoxyribonuclease VII small subunit [Acidobacteria bacterium]|nr:MAG: exodeoxyribonuclease VII small subunit [Acidobacteriota bacterium]REK05613.1 MAG: exodeoxyribonuclease VII small subunit [Acidobacteriota bacterium]
MSRPDPQPTDPPAPAREGSEPSFGEALEELEQTLLRMEDESIDIDDLADELRRASRLLETCRAKLRRAELEVREIVEGMSDAEAEQEP